jgi:nicotinamidase/pyrazinamidase
MNTTQKKTASFDVDPQKSFTPLFPNELPVGGGDEIGAALNFMASLASVRVGSKDAHTPNAPWVVKSHDQMLQPTGLKHADLTWVSHCVPGTEGFNFIDELPPVLDYDFMVYKGVDPELHPYGACYHDLGNTQSTGVIEYLKINGVERVIVGGLALDYCVKTTALQLAAAGFEVVLYLPACRAISDAGAAQAIIEMRKAVILIAKYEQELTELVSN